MKVTRIASIGLIALATLMPGAKAQRIKPL